MASFLLILPTRCIVLSFMSSLSFKSKGALDVGLMSVGHECSTFY